MKPRALSWSSSSRLVEVAPAHAQEDPHDARQDQQVEDPDQEQERARDASGRSARSPGAASSRRSRPSPLRPLMPSANRPASSEHDRRVPEREEEADAERPLAVGHQLARGVVDRADVVGVERVAQAERVGGDARRRCRRRPVAELQVRGATKPSSRPKPTTCRPTIDERRAAPRAATRPASASGGVAATAIPVLARMPRPWPAMMAALHAWCKLFAVAMIRDHNVTAVTIR